MAKNEFIICDDETFRCVSSGKVIFKGTAEELVKACEKGEGLRSAINVLQLSIARLENARDGRKM